MSLASKLTYRCSYPETDCPGTYSTPTWLANQRSSLPPLSPSDPKTFRSTKARPKMLH